MEDNQKGDHNTTTLKSDVVDLFISGNFRELRPAPFVFRLMQNYLPAYSVHQPKRPGSIRNGKNLKSSIFNIPCR